LKALWEPLLGHSWLDLIFRFIRKSLLQQALLFPAPVFDMPPSVACEIFTNLIELHGVFARAFPGRHCAFPFSERSHFTLLKTFYFLGELECLGHPGFALQGL
jgi:hypothetical protein